MFTLEKMIIETVELEDGEMFDDEIWISLVSRDTKLEIREYIEEKGIEGERLRMIHPGGLISNPMNIKLQGEVKSKRIKGREDREYYRIATDFEPIVMPSHPIGRLRFLTKKEG